MSKILEKFKNWGAIVQQKKWAIPLIVLFVIVIVELIVWQIKITRKSKDIISANGRIEATEINISPRITARVKEIYVYEGDYVKAGEVLVCMDTDVLKAQLREAEGVLLVAKSQVAINNSKLIQKKIEKITQEAVLHQRNAELEVAEKRWHRSSNLVEEGAVSRQTADDDYATYKSALAAEKASLSQVDAAEAVIATTKEEVIAAESSVEAATGSVERIQTDIVDSALKTPRDGRVQYRVAQPGEVVAAGSPVLSMVDLSDVYMTIFLPTAYAGRVSIGEEVRLILDTAPQYVIPAYISFISDVAQFTPKTVESATEREKLMFRVKAQIPKSLLQKYMTQIKTGLPGMAYIKLDPDKPWPEKLKVNI